MAKHSALTGTQLHYARFSGARVTHNTTQSIADVTATTVAFNTERFDTDGYHDTVTNNSRLTIPTGLSGYYLIGCHLHWATDNDGYRQIEFRIDGATTIASSRDTPGATSVGWRSQLHTVYQLNAASYVEVRVQHAAGGAINIDNASNSSPDFFITLLGLV